jgi:predicted RNA-binding Zn-ribbon protein involved in translation (DUF1610 family)
MDTQKFVHSIKKLSGCNYVADIAHAEWVLKQKYGNNEIIKTAIGELRTIKPNDPNKCPGCKIQMDIYDEYKLLCPKCGRIIDRNITFFDSPNGYISEGKKQMFSNVKHFLEWIDHILAKEKPAEFTASLDTMRDYVKKNNIQRISPEDLRVMLKKLKLSKYYKHTSYYFKELTNVKPPDIPEKFIYQAKFMFVNFTKVRENTEGLGLNNPSYPFLIYKIFNAILPPTDVENRRIFTFIHLPSEKTLKKRNEEWELIWPKLDKSIRQISCN